MKSNGSGRYSDHGFRFLPRLSQEANLEQILGDGEEAILIGNKDVIASIDGYHRRL